MPAGVDVVADDAPGKGIGDQAQVDRALAGGQIGKVADLALVRGRGLRGIFDPVGVAMVRVGGLYVGPFFGHEQVALAQQSEQ